MNLNFITQAIGAGRLVLQDKAPTLMIIGGVVSMGAAAIVASQKTLYIHEVLAEHVATLDVINTGVENPRLGGYTPEKATADRYKTYGRAGFDLARHYAVPIILFGGGTVLVFSGHRVMLKRNAALAVAFTTVQKAFESYRENVAREMGPEFDRAMGFGFQNREIVDEDGNPKTISEPNWEADGVDPYFRVFEQGESEMWVNDLGINKDLIEVQTTFAQQRLNRQGYLYLSDVYKSLGMEESPLSRLVGWKVERFPDGTKNVPTVDFGLNTPHKDDWKYSRDNAVYLDFNCQGLIIGGIVQKIMEDA